ncbi:MAG TPA: ABC transporter substrate binding protein [Blastocatellia bacterium]|nr:ABC transporter substrate binding protein [Blastocatellia bacterium]
MSLAEDLVRRQVAVLIMSTAMTLVTAKTATKSIPLVFPIGSDPVESGFVTSLNKPGGNITGTYTLNVKLAAKRLELLCELIPAATTIALAVNPQNANFADAENARNENAGRFSPNGKNRRECFPRFATLTDVWR